MDDKGIKISDRDLTPAQPSSNLLSNDNCVCSPMTCSKRTVGVEVAKEDAEAGGRPAATACCVKSHPGGCGF